ncbi:MAG: hypothetical protein ABJD97_03395, partial [Betaproteobacteria bacterium]
VALIRKHHPERSAGIADDALGAEIQRQLQRALGYGLADERSAATYVHSAWLLGLEFDQRIPGLRQILVDPDLPGTRKADALNDFSRTVFTTLGGAAGASR